MGPLLVVRNNGSSQVAIYVDGQGKVGTRTVAGIGRDGIDYLCGRRIVVDVLVVLQNGTVGKGADGGIARVSGYSCRNLDAFDDPRGQCKTVVVYVDKNETFYIPRNILSLVQPQQAK